MNILVVEDDADLCVEIVEYLERRNHRVSGRTTVATARQALAEMVGKAALDGVVCDVGLPDGDGLRLYIESVAQTPNCRWILMSGAHDMERLRRVLKDLNARPVVLEKPLPLKLLCDALEEGSTDKRSARRKSRARGVSAANSNGPGYISPTRLARKFGVLWPPWADISDPD